MSLPQRSLPEHPCPRRPVPYVTTLQNSLPFVIYHSSALLSRRWALGGDGPCLHTIIYTSLNTLDTQWSTCLSKWMRCPVDLRYISVDYKVKKAIPCFVLWQINLVFKFSFYILMFIHSRIEKDGKIDLWIVLLILFTSSYKNFMGKVQFKMICQGIIYLRNRILKKEYSWVRSSVYIMVFYYVSFKPYKPFVFLYRFDKVVLLQNRQVYNHLTILRLDLNIISSQHNW